MTTMMEDRPRFVVPTREQAVAALVKANAVRIKRANLKNELRVGTKTANVVLAWPPDWAATMKVADLLLAVPGLGQVKVNKIMRDCRVGAHKRIGGITERQRNEMIAKLTT